MNDEKSCRYYWESKFDWGGSTILVPQCTLNFRNRVAYGCRCGRFKPRPEVVKLAKCPECGSEKTRLHDAPGWGIVIICDECGHEEKAQSDGTKYANYDQKEREPL